MKDLLTTITKTLSRQPVAFAYLVGSHAKQATTPLSDIDIAVYTDTSSRPDTVVNITSELQGLLGRMDVDVIDLNHAGLPLLHSLLRSAQPILVKNEQTERNFRRTVFRRYADFEPTLTLIGNRTLDRIRQK